jgi:hypothetical protein
MQARQAVLELYNGAGGALQSYMPDAVARLWAPPALQAEDPLTQINGGYVVYSMKSPAVAPALQQMARHANPAVRYYAAASYRDIRYRLLAESVQSIEQMCQALEQLTTADGAVSAPTLTAALEAMNLSAPPAEIGVSPGALSQAQTIVRDCFETVAPSQLYGVRDGRPEWVRAYQQAAETAGSLYQNILGQQKTPGLAVLAQIMANAGQAYFEIAGAGVEPPSALAELLSETEQAIGRIADNDQIRAVRDALDESDPEPAMVKLAVNQLVGVEGSPGRLNEAPWNVAIPEVLPNSQQRAEAAMVSQPQ